MTDGEWHGWRTPEGTLRIGIAPGRKLFCLFVEHEDPSVIRTLAYFNTEEDAKEVMRLLDLLAVGVVDKESNIGGTT